MAEREEGGPIAPRAKGTAKRGGTRNRDRENFHYWSKKLSVASLPKSLFYSTRLRLPIKNTGVIRFLRRRHDRSRHPIPRHPRPPLFSPLYAYLPPRYSLYRYPDFPINIVPNFQPFNAFNELIKFFCFDLLLLEYLTVKEILSEWLRDMSSFS